MSTAVPQFIIVDDVDTSIQYTGQWSEAPNGNQGDVVLFSGPPYRGTLHGANANASLAFAFNGTQIKVLGTADVLNTSGVLDPTWECFIDNISIGASPILMSGLENNQVLCNNDSLVDGPHVLTVNATPINFQTFWFDDIQYVPSASVPLDQAAIIINNTDPRLQYAGPGWVPLSTSGPLSNVTAEPGSILTYNFIGVSLSWYGTIIRGDPVLASYSIDGQTPIIFTFERLNDTNALVNYSRNQLFFQTVQLTAGPHTLTVVSVGYPTVDSTLPSMSYLALDYLIVQNGTLSSTTTSASSQVVTSSVTPTTTTSSTGKSSTPTGAIVGGVVGGFSLVIFVLLGFLLLRRRHWRHAAQGNDPLSTPTPLDCTLHPSNATASGGISYSQSPQTMQMGRTVTYGVKGQVHHASIPITGLGKPEPEPQGPGSDRVRTAVQANIENSFDRIL